MSHKQLYNTNYYLVKNHKIFGQLKYLIIQYRKTIKNKTKK